MNKTKHTPGPWEIGALLGDPDGKSYEYPTIYRINEDGSTTYVADIMGANSPQAMPNARLIAAAPDLLEVLEEVESRMARHGSGDVLFHSRVMAAIAKATGE
jgi:hypothetical protein